MTVLPPILNRHNTGDTLPEGAVYVGRPSRWGNPCTIQRYGTRTRAIEAHAAWFATQDDLLGDVRRELRGRPLVCWCVPQDCHARTLRAAANAPLRVISGGQTGVDQAGLRAARACGLETGGWAPRGWRTDIGPEPGLAAFGLRAHPSASYQGRTRANVDEADATILFGALDSPGTRLTRNYAQSAGRPACRVRWPNAVPLEDLVHRVRIWIARGAYATVNVAGNRERVFPGIGAIAEDFFTRVFA